MPTAKKRRPSRAKPKPAAEVVPLTETQRENVERNVGAAFFHSARIRRNAPRFDNIPAEDADQAVLLGLTRAALTWDPAKGRFTTWMAFRIRKELQEEYARQFLVRPPCWHVYQHRAEGRSFRSPVVAGAEHPDPASSQSFEVSEAIDEVSRVLPKRFADVILGVYRDGETLTESGARLGISWQRVQQIHDRAIARLRRLWEGKF